MAKNFMEKRYSPEEALKTLEFLQSAVDSVRCVMVGILDQHVEAAQRMAGEEADGDLQAIVMAINPSGYIDVFTAQEFRQMTEEDDAFCEQDIVFDEQLLIHCNADDVVELGGTETNIKTSPFISHQPFIADKCILSSIKPYKSFASADKLLYLSVNNTFGILKKASLSTIFHAPF